MNEQLLKHFEVNLHEYRTFLKFLPAATAKKTLFFVNPVDLTVRFNSQTHLISDLTFKRERGSRYIAIIDKDGKYLGRITHLAHYIVQLVSLLPLLLFFLYSKNALLTLLVIVVTNIILNYVFLNLLTRKLNDNGLRVE
jgi:hypothetical protein